MHKGARVPTGDYFDDILGDNDEAGTLAGQGLKDFDRVKEKIDQNGAHVDLNCRGCNRGGTLHIGYDELYYVAQNGPGKPLVLPQGWERSENNRDLYTQLTCGHCHEPGSFAVHYTPEQAQHIIVSAINSGFVTKPQVDQWKGMLQMYRGA